MCGSKMLYNELILELIAWLGCSSWSTSRMVATSLVTLVIAVVVSPQISAGGNLQRS